MTWSDGPPRWDRGDLSAGHTPPSADTDGPGASLHGDAPGPSTRGHRRIGGGQAHAPAEDDPLGWDLFDDADEEDDGPPRGRRGRLLLVAAVVPWLLVGAVLVRTPSDPPDASPATSETGHDEHGPPAEAPLATAGASEDGTTVDGPADPWPATSDGEWSDAPVFTEPDALILGGRVSAGAGEAAAVGLLVAREWLGDIGVSVATDLGSDASGTYVEHLIAEDVDLPAPGAAVVTVVAVVLTVEGDAYGGAELVRLAVPVRLDREGARPAGAPWRLPPPDLRVDDLDTTEVDEPAIATDAGAALIAAGYEVVEVVSIATSDGWPLVVTVEAIAPGETTARRHDVWVRQHLDRLVVAGWVPDVTTDTDGRPIDGRAARTDEDGGAPSPATTQDD